LIFNLKDETDRREQKEVNWVTLTQ